LGISNKEDAMRLGRLVSGVVTLSMAASLALAIDVNTDFDKDVDFSKYKTYSWAHTPDSGNQLSDKRIVESIDGQLQARGWKKAAEGATGDAVIAAHAAKESQERLDTFYTGWGVGYGYGGWAMPVGGATTVSSVYEIGSLLVDIFDAGTKKLLWRGTASATLSTNPDSNKKKLAKVTKRMFQNFPPEPAKKK
jgi:hypothetical protein